MATKMTREEALNKVRQMSLPKETMEIFEALAPELAESEDEQVRKGIVKFIVEQYPECWKDKKNKMLAYLEKQKEQKPAEWSEEDEKDMAHIIRILDDCYVYGTHDLSKTDHENLVNKLKSLRPSWKPSEEQMEALYRCVDYLEESDNEDAEFMESLLEQLKKLM